MPITVADIGDGAEVRNIRARLADWKAAYDARDADRIMEFYAPGDEIIAYDIMPPLEYSGERSFRESWGKFFGAFTEGPTIEFKDQQIKCSEDVAFAHSLSRVTGMMNGNRLDLWFRETNGLRKIDGEWRIVHAHVSVPMDLATGQALVDLRP